eukprot:1061908_1
MPKIVSLKLNELRKRGYNNISEWISDPTHLYIGRKMNIRIYTHFKTMEPPGTDVRTHANGNKILFRPYPMQKVPFDKHLLSYPVGSYVDKKGQIVHLCCIEQSKWHNPFKMSKTNTRSHVINAYERYLLSKKPLLNDLHQLEQYTELGCWCKPLECHGDIILKHYHKYKIRHNRNKQNVDDDHCIDVWNMSYSNKEEKQSNQQHTQEHKSQYQLTLTPQMINSISVQSALCIIPPQCKWQTIQNIRKIYDPGYNRWFPHIIYYFHSLMTNILVILRPLLQIQSSVKIISNHSLSI